MSGIFRKARKYRDEPQQQPVPAPLAPPPAQVAPAPVPPAAPAPAPAAPAQEAPRAKAWPYGASEFVPGAWYVRHGSANAGPFSKPEEYWAWVKQVEQLDANNAQMMREQSWKADGRGQIPVTSLSRNDAAYVHHRSHGYTLARRNGDLFRDLCSGAHDDIARAIQMGDIANPGMNAWTPDNGLLPAAVDALFASIPPEWRN